jgi:hypothetical protein
MNDDTEKKSLKHINKAQSRKSEVKDNEIQEQRDHYYYYFNYLLFYFSGGPAVVEWVRVVEELHWLLLMTGNLVADSRYLFSASLAAKNLKSKFLSFFFLLFGGFNLKSYCYLSEWESSSSIPRIVCQHEHNTGTVLQLIRTCFNLLEWENQCVNSNRTHHLSPLLSATLLWFCDRIVRSYLFRHVNQFVFFFFFFFFICEFVFVLCIYIFILYSQFCNIIYIYAFVHL